MPSKVIVHTAIGLLLSGLMQPLVAQTEKEQGFLGGTRIFTMPSTELTPLASFRTHVGHLSSVSGKSGGMTNFGLTTGLSSNLEAYFGLLTNKSEMFLPATSYQIGGKLLLPFEIVSRLDVSLWAESISGSGVETPFGTSSNMTHAGLIGGYDASFGRPNFVLGFSQAKGEANPLIGAGMTKVLGGSVKIGGEVLYGYYGGKDLQATTSVGLNLFSHIGLQISPGFLRQSDASHFFVAAGLSVSTAVINFLPDMAQAGGDSDVPSFDEIEQETLRDAFDKPLGALENKESVVPRESEKARKDE